MDEEMRLILKDYFDEKWNDGYQQGVEYGRKESAEKMEKMSDELAESQADNLRKDGIIADLMRRLGNPPTLQPT